MSNYCTWCGQMNFADAQAYKYAGNSNLGLRFRMSQRVVLHKREWRGGVIMVTLSPIAKGIRSLLFDYSLTETRRIKRIITQTSQWSPITPWHTPLRRFISHRPDYCVYVCLCFSNRVCLLSVLHSCVNACMCLHPYACASVWKCISV